MKNNFAQNVRQLRLIKNVRQEDVAKALGTTQRKVSYWENGSTEPDIDMLIQISDYFEVTIDELVGKTD